MVKANAIVLGVIKKDGEDPFPSFRPGCMKAVPLRGWGDLIGEGSGGFCFVMLLL